jgi:ABC-2 type transport system permease protein
MNARAYWAVVSARYRMLLQYRVAAFAGFMTQLFWGAVRLMIFGAFFAVSTVEQPLSLGDIVAYVWLGQALLGLLPWNVDQEIAEKIQTGDVAYELLRPLDLYAFWYFRTLAFRCAGTTLRLIPMVVFAMLLLPAVGLDAWALAPPAPGQGWLFALSMTITVLLATAITMLTHISLVWTISGEGFNRLMPGLSAILSGMIVPLPLYPEWLQPLLNWQPFRGLCDVPYRIYTGNIAAADAMPEIAQQLMWVVLIVGFGYWLLNVGTRRVVVQGG